MLEMKEVVDFLRKAEVTKKHLGMTTLIRLPLSVENLIIECNMVIKLCETIIELKEKLNEK